MFQERRDIGYFPFVYKCNIKGDTYMQNFYKYQYSLRQIKGISPVFPDVTPVTFICC